MENKKISEGSVVRATNGRIYRVGEIDGDKIIERKDFFGCNHYLECDVEVFQPTNEEIKRLNDYDHTMEVHGLALKNVKTKNISQRNERLFQLVNNFMVNSNILGSVRRPDETIDKAISISNKILDKLEKEFNKNLENISNEK